MHVWCSCSGEGVSARLRPALEGLADQLARLSRHMDQVVFRDMWRAVAVAANRMMYNDVATEAQFSAEVQNPVLANPYTSWVDIECND